MAKIVQLSSVHPSNDTRIFHKICKSLVNAGYSLDLIIQNEKNETREGVNIIALPIAEKKSDRIFKIIPKLIKLSFKYPKSTFFHFHDPELIIVGLLLKMFGYRVIYDVHEDVPKDVLTKEWIPIVLRLLLSKSISIIERFSSNYFDQIITVVPSITERFKNRKVVELRNYPFLESNIYDNYQSSPANKYIVYVGSLTERRGLPILVDALPYVNEPNLTLKIGGVFNNDGLEDLLKSKKGWGNVKLLGWVHQNELLQLLEGATAGMVVLGDIPSHRGSFPVKMFEYMRAGIPIIASDFPLWREIVQDCGLLVAPNSPQEIADAINWVLENPEKAKEMGENGLKLVRKKYNWTNEEKKLLVMYENLFFKPNTT